MGTPLTRGASTGRAEQPTRACRWRPRHCGYDTPPGRCTCSTQLQVACPPSGAGDQAAVAPPFLCRASDQYIAAAWPQYVVRLTTPNVPSHAAQRCHPVCKPVTLDCQGCRHLPERLMCICALVLVERPRRKPRRRGIVEKPRDALPHWPRKQTASNGTVTSDAAQQLPHCDSSQRPVQRNDM